MAKMVFKDHYATLSIPKTSTAAQIRTAFHKAALQYHPDKQISNCAKRENTPFFRTAKEAFDVLTNPDARARYDLEYDQEQISLESEPSVAWQERQAEARQKAKVRKQRWEQQGELDAKQEAHERRRKKEKREAGERRKMAWDADQASWEAEQACQRAEDAWRMKQIAKSLQEAKERLERERLERVELQETQEQLSEMVADAENFRKELDEQSTRRKAALDCEIRGHAERSAKGFANIQKNRLRAGQTSPMTNIQRILAAYEARKHAAQRQQAQPRG
jgi:curved DNA-binding protein CbpA